MVRQYTNYWCVPAATQSMVNLVRGTSNRAYVTQKYYYKLTRQHNRYTYATKGNDPQGWAWSLRLLHARRCRTTPPAHSPTRRRPSTRSPTRSTGPRHPVGVTVRGGTHAWVVLGYRMSQNLERSRQADAPRPLRQRPARHVGRPVAVPLPHRLPVPRRLHSLPRVAAAGHLGRQVGRGLRVTLDAPDLRPALGWAAHVRRHHGGRGRDHDSTL